MIHAFGEAPVAARLHIRRRLSKILARGKGLSRDAILTIRVSAGGRQATFNIPQRAPEPVFSANIIRLSAILQRLARKAPVAIVLKPGDQVMTIRNGLESAHIVDRDQIRDQSAPVPQEAVGLIPRTHDEAIETGQPRHGVIAVFLAENLCHIISPVLRSDLITIQCDMLETLALIFWDAAKELAHHGIEMLFNSLAAHLVALQACSLRRRRGALHLC